MLIEGDASDLVDQDTHFQCTDFVTINEITLKVGAPRDMTDGILSSYPDGLTAHAWLWGGEGRDAGARQFWHCDTSMCVCTYVCMYQ